MDLPKSKYYGVRCPKCPAIFWDANQKKIELMLNVSFPDKGLPLIEEQLGLVVGFGNFKHVCRPDLDR